MLNCLLALNCLHRHRVFEGDRIWKALREAIASHLTGGGACARVRCGQSRTKDRHAVDRAAISRLLAQALHDQAEGRIDLNQAGPGRRSISQLGTLWPTRCGASAGSLAMEPARVR